MQMIQHLHTATPLFVLMVAAALLGACRKNADEALELLSNAEAAELVESSVSARTAGMTMPVDDLATLLSSASLDCNTAADTSFQRSSTAGPVNYQYQVDLGWLVHCNNAGIPQSADLSLTGAGAFATQRWSGSDQTEGALLCTGLNPQASAYLFNGNYGLEGQLTGQLRNIDPTLDVSIALQLTDLSLRKSDRLITGGTGAFTLTATNGRGRTETITGTLVFNGDGTATVTVNGYAHTFPLK